MLRNFVFFGGKRIARKDASGNVVHYYFADHLGTADVVTSANGTIENESDYYPWTNRENRGQEAVKKLARVTR
jgi:uncharacterized protein RhaS with RHS repeats